MSACVVRCRGLHPQRRPLRAATSAPAAAPRAPLRCRAEAARSGADSAACNAALSRRLVLAAGGAAALLRAERAAADEDEAWTRYTRAFRERFETSISSATRAYTFEHPASWGPGALLAERCFTGALRRRADAPGTTLAEIVSLNDGKLYGVDLRLRNKQEGVQLAVSLLPYGALPVALPASSLSAFDSRYRGA